MPQIQVIAGSQRIEPGSPVAAISSDNSRLANENLAAFGKEVFNLGNALDAVGKRAKENEDKLNVTRAINQARLEMLKVKAAQDAEPVNQQDSPDGVDGINRYNEKLNPILAGIADQLASPKQKEMFAAGISDDIVTYSTQVLAGEVSKREKNVPILMEDSLRQRGELARRGAGDLSKIPQVTQQMADEYELDVLHNTMIPDSAKPKMILDGKKQIAREALMGYIDAGNGGNDSAWNQYRYNLVSKFANLYTAEEKDKLMDAVNQQEYSYYNREWQNVQRKNAMDDRYAKQKVRDKTAQYMAALANAGNSDTARAPILRTIEMDADLDFDPAAKKRLIENRTFMETSDDAYQLRVMDNVLRTKNFTKLLDQIQVDAGSRVSLDRATKLQQAIRSMQDFNQKNPYIMKALDQARDELNNYKKPPTFDVVSGMMRQENDTYNEKAQTELMSWAARQSAAGSITAGQIEGKLNSILKQYYGGRTVVKPVQGVAPDKLSTSQGIKETSEQLYKDFKAGKYNSPEKKIELQNKLRDLKVNQDAVKTKESAAVRTQNTGNSKIFDE